MKRLLCILCLSLSSVLAADLVEIAHTTYRIQGSSDTLHIASSQGKFLYAGLAGADHAKCELGKDSNIFYFNIKDAPQEGTLTCGDVFKANFKKDKIDNVQYKQQAATLTKASQFSTFQGLVTHELRKGISITLRPLCSNDNNIQDILTKLYDVEFTCKDMNEQFSVVAKESLGDDFEKGERYEVALLDAIMYFDDNMIVINEYNHLYTGGAHGMGGQASRVFDRQKKTAQDLNALFDPSKADDLKDLLWNKLQSFGSSNIFVGKSEFTLSDNITISYDGISFVYQPYELLPYSFGSPHLTLSFKEAKAFLLKPYGLGYLFK